MRREECRALCTGTSLYTLVVCVFKCMALSPQDAEVIVWNNSLLFEEFWKLC